MSLWDSLRQWIRRRGTRRGAGPRGPGRRRHRPYRPRLEVLEERNLLSTFTVNHLADDLVLCQHWNLGFHDFPNSVRIAGHQGGWPCGRNTWFV
jgi:hypothetical protein